MTNLVYRNVVFRPLTYSEIDSNFRQLDSAIGNIDISATVDSAFVNALVDHPENVSEFQNDAGYLTSADAIDATTLGGNDSGYYLDYTNFTNTPTIPTDNSELTNGEGYLDSVGVQTLIDTNNLSAFDSSDVPNVVDSAFMERFSVDNLGDVNLSGVAQDQFLQWNGTQWHNVDFHVDQAVNFHGVVDVTSSTAPGSPANGDFYINNGSGTVDNSWTGAGGTTVTGGENFLWSTDDSQWYVLSGSATGSGTGVLQVSGGTGITVTDSPDHQYISVAVDDTYLSTQYAPLSTAVLTSGNQTIAGTKTFSSTISGNISGNAAYATNAGNASTATTAVRTQASFTINGTSFNGQTARSLSLPTTDTVTQIRGGSSAYLKGNITIQGSGGTSVSQSGSTITVSSTSSTYVGQTGILVSGNDIYMKPYQSNIPYRFELLNADNPTLTLLAQTNARGAELFLQSNADFHPDNKSIRANHNNNLEIVNGTYSAVIAYLTDTGNFFCTSLTELSDENRKENIKTAEVGLIDQLRGVEFDWKETGKHSAGLVAQEVQKVLPHLVYESNDDVDGKEEGKHLSLNYTGLIGYLIEEIKQLKKDIAALS